MPDAMDVPVAEPRLTRSLNLPQAISLNVANMVGIGPFIVIPAFFKAMGGPQAMVAWLVAGVLVLCDGLVWSELGAALPGSGGSYHFLREIYGGLHPTWGRLIPFLFIWQFLISGTFEAASAYIGTMDYLKYIYPNLEPCLAQWRIPGGTSTVAACLSLIVMCLLLRHIGILGWFGLALCLGTLASLLAVIAAGLPHFSPVLLEVSSSALRWENAGNFAHGLGAAMTIAIYCYLGYYNICHLGDEVRDPGRTIPRAVISSIWIIAALYIAMNLAVIGAIPWQEVVRSDNSIVAQLIDRFYGRTAAVALAWMVAWTGLAGAFAVTLGYSRIPFAAARRGDFFAVFSTLHARGFPVVSILAFGTLTAVSCYFPLEKVINMAVAVRILVQFIGQIVALHLLRTTRPDVPMPFRMRLYPLPSLIALAGWLFVLCTSDWQVLFTAVGVSIAGLPAFFAWRMFSIRQPSPQVLPPGDG
jgi:amino acid transporter